MTDFNSDFYVTAATAIPVLTLGLTLQSQFVLDVAVKVRHWRDQKEREAHRASGSVLRRAIGVGVRGWMDSVVFMAAVAVPIVWGTVGELCAVAALSGRQATSTEAGWVLSSFYVMTVSVGLWAVVRFYVTLSRSRAQDAKTRTDGERHSVDP